MVRRGRDQAVGGVLLDPLQEVVEHAPDGPASTIIGLVKSRWRPE